jgi:hypothetical protein
LNLPKTTLRNAPPALPPPTEPECGSVEAFDADFVKRVIEEQCQTFIADRDYDPADRKATSSLITDAIIRHLTSYYVPKYKFLIHLLFMRDGEDGYETFAQGFWDPPKDGLAAAEYANGKVRVIVTIWGLHCNVLPG